MVKNIMKWDSEWEHAQQVEDNLRKLEGGGKIARLCFMPGGRACFQTEERANSIPQGLSELFSGSVIEHEWAGEDACGSALWQDGRASLCEPSHESPEWDALEKSVEERMLAWETRRDFQEKVDACWQAQTAKWRGLTLDQIGEQSATIAATRLCYDKLKGLTWHYTWLTALNQLADPLEAVRNAWLTAMGENLSEEFLESGLFTAICDAADSVEAGQAQDEGPDAAPALTM